MDWEDFKTKEGIQEELERHNKDGFLEKRAFLDKVELAQWEKERELKGKAL